MVYVYLFFSYTDAPTRLISVLQTKGYTDVSVSAPSMVLPCPNYVLIFKITYLFLANLSRTSKAMRIYPYLS
jgi:hypothetical protein